MLCRILVILSLLVAVIPMNSPGEQGTCDSQYKIFVTPDHADDFKVICKAVDKAIELMAHYNLQPKRAISIKVVDAKISNEGLHAFGSYDSRDDIIRLMSYRSIFEEVESPGMYGESFDRVHYFGAIAHEVSHAVMQHNLKSKAVSQARQEYLAHAIQLAVMPETRRKSIVNAMAVGPWVSGDVVSDTYMALEPGKFAAKSYLHLSSMKEPQAFIEILLKSNWFYVTVP